MRQPARSRLRAGRTAGLVTVMLAAPVAVAAVSVLPAAAVTPTTGGVYTLASGSSGKCVDVTGASTANAALLVQIGCLSTAADQQFRLVSQSGGHALVNVNSGKCADVPYSSTTSGTQLWQWTCGGSANQTWLLTASSAVADRFLVKSVSSGLCMSNKDGSTAGGNPIVQEPCADIARMQWRFNLVGGTPPPTTPPPTTPAPGPVLAFPGAVGFGAKATGGRGGSVYRVTNLNDSGAGSFRDAVSAGPRIVVFDVGGYINLRSPLSIKSNITIAGQTAPGDGVATRGYQVSLSGSTNVIVRYMRFRHGLTPEQNRDGVSIDSGSNQILDHVSVSWGRDETFSINNSTNITVQNSIISEGLDPHSCGGLVQSDGVTIHQSLYAHNKTRNPKVKGRNQFVNNVVYNWGSDAYIEGDSAGRSDANVVGNYFIKGPSTGSGGPFTRGNLNFHIYAAGNYYDDNRNGAVDGRAVTTADLGNVVVEPTPFDFPAVPTVSAAAAYQAVVNGAGASLRRDAIDQRVISDLTRQTGKIITDPATVGGFGSLAGGSPAVDTDRDGMADTWEQANGLNPNNAADGPVIGSDGYSNVERYLNGLAR